MGAALAGCTQTDTGQPVAADHSSPAPGQTSVAIPPRPKELKIDGLDPCKVMTKSQLDQIKVDRQRNLTLDKDPFKGSPLCSMDGGDGKVFWNYELTLVTTEGVASWFNGKHNVDVKLVDVGGFGAAQYKILGTSNVDCATAVDVANGQQMVMQFKPSRNSFTQSQMCQKSEQAAGLALQALQTPK
ncbi:DUF3558 domain-containing protein [Kibdelosporangium lantanae]|uniref:DUF3558 domain-containing protein n=1 Tax=Kibdelosporangium lantanae TaxID=1497396 RepID=A0ABW3MB72_9PSEU